MENLNDKDKSLRKRYELCEASEDNLQDLPLRKLIEWIDLLSWLQKIYRESFYYIKYSKCCLTRGWSSKKWSGCSPHGNIPDSMFSKATVSCTLKKQPWKIWCATFNNGIVITITYWTSLWIRRNNSSIRLRTKRKERSFPLSNHWQRCVFYIQNVGDQMVGYY